MSVPRRIWAEMTTAEIAEADTSDWIAVIALGAVEQHGPHLPLATDSLIGSALTALSMEMIPDEIPVTAMPMIEVGKSEEHLGYPGVVSLGTAEMTAIIRETAESAIRAGVRKVVIVNAHGGNSPLLDLVTRDLRRRYGVLAVATSWSRFGVPEELVAKDEIVHGIHGGQIETSLMLYIRPELVRMERAETFVSLQELLGEEYELLRAHGPVAFGWMAEDLNAAGVVGDAAAATPEIGQAIAQHQAQAFAKLCEEVHDFVPPWFEHDSQEDRLPR